MTKVARFSSPILLVLSLVLAACAQPAPAQPTAVPQAAAAPTNTVAPVPTNTTAPVPTNTTAPVPTNTVAPAPTNTVAAAPTNTAAPAKPAAPPAVGITTRALMEEWVKNNPEFTKESKIVSEGSADGKAFVVQLSPATAKPNDPSLITVGVHQSESSAAALAQLNKMGDAIKADGSTREEHKDVLGNRPVIIGARSTADTAEGSLFFQSNDRVGFVQVVLPPDKKGVINEGLGIMAASLLLQLDPAGAAQLVAPAKPAAAPPAAAPKPVAAGAAKAYKVDAAPVVKPTPAPTTRKGVANPQVAPEKYLLEIVDDMEKLGQAMTEVEKISTAIGTAQNLPASEELRLLSAFQAQADAVYAIYQREVARDYPPELKAVDDAYVETLRSASLGVDSFLDLLITGEDKHLVDWAGHMQDFARYADSTVKLLSKP